MQIDFHHAVTYVCARLAGFEKDDAEIIAYSAQYVDDATNGGTIEFDNGALYTRIASAHKMLDHRHFIKEKSYRVWIPFHFLPGNEDLPENSPNSSSFFNKLVCRPNSYVAKDMVKMCIADKDKKYGLHRLGITMHVFADTWAHKNFAGIIHTGNKAKLPKELRKPKISMLKKVTRFINTLPPLDNRFNPMILGHASAATYPDQPYLYWSYKNEKRKNCKREHPEEFLEAAVSMHKVMQEYRGVEYAPMHQEDIDTIYKLLINTKDPDKDVRHKAWLGAIADGTFTFGSENLEYIAKGYGSWKHLAIGELKEEDYGDEIYIYRDEFLKSNWKMFHDALQAHRLDIIHQILPKYGISAG